MIAFPLSPVGMTPLPRSPRSAAKPLAVVLIVALAVLFGIARSEPAAARSRGAANGATEGGERISMGVGKSVILDLPQEAAEIFVGNPSVANAVVRTARKLYVIGVANGQTSIYALDRQGRQFASFEISIGRDIGELSQILHAAMPTTAIVVRTVNDTVILTGTVDSSEDAQRAYDIAKGFAKNGNAGGVGQSDGLVINSLIIRGRDQVMLKVTISEMRRDIAKQLGISSSTWGVLSQTNPFNVNGVIAAATSAVGSGGEPVGSNIGISSGSNLRATLQAFERNGVTRTLAEPTVTAISGESAKFLVGGEFPYSTGVTCSGGVCTPGVSFKDYGITLNFSPVVLSEGRILLHLATEVSDLDFAHSVTISGSPTPALLVRRNETTVELPSGGSIATAGLIQQQSAQVINGLPGLLNLPILGALFRSRDYQKSESELIIIVTPIIVKSVRPNAIAKPDDGFSDASDPQAWLLGRMNRLYATPSNPEAAKNYRGRVGFIQD